MLKRLKKLDIPIIYFTAALIIIAGFLRVIKFQYSGYILTYGMVPYIIVRGAFFILSAKKKQHVNRNRLYIFLAILITFMLSIFDLFSADFFMIFLIMLDYLQMRNENLVQK